MGKKEKASEPKISFVETDLVELNLKVPHLSPQNAQIIARDLQYTLKTSAKLQLLNEFIETRIVEYREEAN